MRGSVPPGVSCSAQRRRPSNPIQPTPPILLGAECHLTVNYLTVVCVGLTAAGALRTVGEAADVAGVCVGRTGGGRVVGQDDGAGPELPNRPCISHEPGQATQQRSPRAPFALPIHTHPHLHPCTSRRLGLARLPAPDPNPPCCAPPSAPWAVPPSVPPPPMPLVGPPTHAMWSFTGVCSIHACHRNRGFVPRRPHAGVLVGASRTALSTWTQAAAKPAVGRAVALAAMGAASRMGCGDRDPDPCPYREPALAVNWEGRAKGPSSPGCASRPAALGRCGTVDVACPLPRLTPAHMRNSSLQWAPALPWQPHPWSAPSSWWGFLDGGRGQA